MIPLWPYQKLVFNSPLSREELTRRLAREVAKSRWGFALFERRKELFEGTITGEGFKISRIIRYRNSFLPVVQGNFSPIAKGIRVDVTLRLHGGVLAFSVVWLSFIVLGLVGVASEVLRSRQLGQGSLIPFAMLAFFYLLVTFSFGFEARKARKLLSEVFEAEAMDGRNDWTTNR
jgi:hypothetical protein